MSRLAAESTLSQSRPGFSLLELLVVLAILSIVGSLAIAQLTPLLSQARFNAGVRKIVSDLQLVRMRAVARNQRVRVTFRPDTQDYIVEESQAGSWVRQRLHGYGTDAAPEATIPLPQGVRIAAVNSRGDVIFIPRGHVDAGMTLTLSADGGETLRRIIINLAGRVRIE